MGCVKLNEINKKMTSLVHRGLLFTCSDPLAVLLSGLNMGHTELAMSTINNA